MTVKLVMLAVLGLVLLSGASAARVADHSSVIRADWNPPAFCHGYDCPKFQVLKTDNERELRKYEPATWISTNVTDKKFDDAFAEGIKELQKYVNGENENKTKIATTTPYFAVLYPTKKERAVDTRFTIEYFLPFKLQEYPPKPKAEELDFVDVPEQEVWVRSFDGFAKEKDVIDHAFDFMDQLRSEKVEIVDDAFGFAQYDSAARLVGRHNEVHIWTKQKPSSMRCASCHCSGGRDA